MPIRAATLWFFLLSTSSMADPLSFTQAWVRATPPGASTAAAYLEIHNTGSSDRLLSLHWQGSGQLEIHTVEHQDGMMRMIQLDTLAVPASHTIQLQPGGKHIMFVDIGCAFVEGNTVELTLVFENAGERTISLPIKDGRNWQR